MPSIVFSWLVGATLLATAPSEDCAASVTIKASRPVFVSLVDSTEVVVQMYRDEVGTTPGRGHVYAAGGTVKAAAPDLPMGHTLAFQVALGQGDRIVLDPGDGRIRYEICVVG